VDNNGTTWEEKSSSNGTYTRVLEILDGSQCRSNFLDGSYVKTLIFKWDSGFMKEELRLGVWSESVLGGSL
jgi:hypothetical protein